MPLLARVYAVALRFAKRILGRDRYDRWRAAALLELSRHADRRENNRCCRPGPQILVVSEGHKPLAYRELLDWLSEHDPALRASIRLARLPIRFPRATHVLHAWVQDPVRERSAATFQQLGELEASARNAGARVIQPARVLSNSVRQVQFERLTQVGVRSPRIVRVGPGFAQHLGGLRLPIIARRAWGHAADMVLLETADAVTAWTEAEGDAVSQWIGAEYIDVRGADGYYRKYRYIMAGHRGISRHLLISPNWEVRPADRVLSESTIHEELEFVGTRCRHHDAFDAARRALEFDIAAFDFSYTRAGDLVVWEVNPFPDLSGPKGRPGVYLADSVERTNRMMADLYRQTLAEAGAPLPVR